MAKPISGQARKSRTKREEAAPPPAKTAPKTRRTQQERRAATREALLNATLASLRRRGYAATSLSEITKKARLSSGALLHHFPTKKHLVAAAMVHLYQQRSREMRDQQAATQGGLRERLHRLRAQYDEWFPVTLEFMNAMRTDPELRQEFERQIVPWVQPIEEEYDKSTPEFAGRPDARYVNYVIGCFVRGLCLEQIVNETAKVDAIFDQFILILERFAATPPPR
jgi:AcrR family transcriptional regulator